MSCKPIKLKVTGDIFKGRGIESIEKTSTDGLIDTYTITYSDGTTSTYTVTNGESVIVDEYLDPNSTNPVQNRAVMESIDDLYEYVPLQIEYIRTYQNIKNVTKIIQAMSKGRGIVVQNLYTGTNSLTERKVAVNITNWFTNGSTVFAKGINTTGQDFLLTGTTGSAGDTWTYQILVDPVAEENVFVVNSIYFTDADVDNAEDGATIKSMYEAMLAGKRVIVNTLTMVTDVAELPSWYKTDGWRVNGNREIEWWPSATAKIVGSYNENTGYGKFVYTTVVDDALNSYSRNAVQNKVIYNELNTIKARLVALEGGN